MPMQLVFRFDTPENQSFDAYVSGENALAVASLKKLISAPSERLILLWGASGVGKTHLLMATGAEASDLGLRVSYIPCAEFASAFPMMLESLEQRDLVLFDDIDALAGIGEAEEALFHCLNKLRDANVALVVTASQPPQMMSIQLADVRSRLGHGLVFRVAPLLDNDLSEALQQWAQFYQIHLPDEVIRYLLQQCSREPKVLRELVQLLAEQTLLKQHRLTLQFVKNCIREKMADPS